MFKVNDCEYINNFFTEYYIEKKYLYIYIFIHFIR